MTLDALPNAQLVVAAHADDIAGRVGERENGAVVSLDAVEAGAGEQVPDAQHSVLRPRPRAEGLDGVDESRCDRAAVAVQGVDGQVIIEANDSKRMILLRYERLSPLFQLTTIF